MSGHFTQYPNESSIRVLSQLLFMSLAESLSSPLSAATNCPAAPRLDPVPAEDQDLPLLTLPPAVDENLAMQDLDSDNETDVSDDDDMDGNASPTATK